MWRWLYRRANRCRITIASQDPYDMTCHRHDFRTQSLTDLQAHMVEVEVETAKALTRRIP